MAQHESGHARGVCQGKGEHMTYPFAGIIQTKLTQDENGNPVIAWKEVTQPTEWARIDKDCNVTHLDMDLCAKGPHNAYTALALAIWNRAIEEAVKYAVGEGNDTLADSIRELKK
jgi:hypothetical protein